MSGAGAGARAGRSRVFLAPWSRSRSRLKKKTRKKICQFGSPALQNTVLFQTAPFQQTLMNLNDHAVVVDRTFKPPFKPYLHHSKIPFYSKPHRSKKPWWTWTITSSSSTVPSNHHSNRTYTIPKYYYIPNRTIPTNLELERSRRLRRRLSPLSSSRLWSLDVALWPLLNVNVQHKHWHAIGQTKGYIFWQTT